MPGAFQRMLVSGLVVLFGLGAGSVWAQPAPTSPKKQVVLQKGPRLFVPNAGQWPTPEVARLVLNEVTVHVEQEALVFSVRVPDSIRPSDATAAVANQWAVRQHFVGASPNVLWELDSSGLASGVEHHFYLGSKSANWRTGVPGGSRLIGKGLYPGVDLVLEVINDQLKSTWIAAQGSNLAAVSVEWLGTSDWRRTSDGGVAVQLGKDWAQETAPTASGSRGEPLAVGWRARKGRLQFSGAVLRHIGPVRVDPTYIFSTFSGGTSDNFGYCATYDANGRTWSGGVSFGPGYPNANGFQPAFQGGGCDVVLTLWKPDGTGYRSSTFLGGNNREAPHSIIAAPNGDLLVFGTTGSTNFPHHLQAFDTTFAGGSGVSADGVFFNNGTDMFVVRLDSTGSVFRAGTYLGGVANDGINVEPASVPLNYGDPARGELITNPLGRPGLSAKGEIFVASSTLSPDFPTVQPSVLPGIPRDTATGGNLDGVLFRMSPHLDTLRWSVKLAGSAYDAWMGLAEAPSALAFGQLMAVGATKSDNLARGAGVLSTQRVGLADGILGLFDVNTGSRIRSTYWGTPGYDALFSVASNPAGATSAVGTPEAVAVTGQNRSPASTPVFSMTPGVWGQPNSAQFIHYIGTQLDTVYRQMSFGNGQHQVVNAAPTALAWDDCGNTFYSGWGGLVNSGGNTLGLATTPNALDTTTDGSDFYFLVLAPDGQSARYASFFGGTALEHVDGGTSRFSPSGVIHQAICAGCGGSSNFPIFPANAHSTTNNSSNCNIAAVQIALEVLNVGLPGLKPMEGCAPLTVGFAAEAQNASSLQVDWGDGNSAQPAALLGLSHTYNVPGNYTVKVIGFDSICNSGAQRVYQVVVRTGTGGMNPPSIQNDTCSESTLGVLVPALVVPQGVNYRIRWGDASDTSWYGGWSAAATHRYPGTGPYRGWVVFSDTVCQVKDSLPFRFRFAVPLSAAPIGVEVDACAQPPQVRVQGAVIGATRYTWYPQGWTGPSVTGSRAAWTVPALGTYTVYLVAEDTACGRSDTTRTLIQVIPLDSTSMRLPNVFTPDNNGTNDWFGLPPAGQVGGVVWTLQVYNRWGERVYATSDPAAQWDGTRGSLPLPEGVYFYIAQWSDGCGNGGDLHGSVTLLRNP